MNAVPASLIKAFGQLGDPAIARVAAKSIGITLLIFVVAGFALYGALTWFFAWMGWQSGGLAEAAAAAIIAIIGFWFLFRVVALAVLQFFADEIVTAVEARHYPDSLEKAEKLPFAQDLSNSLRGLGRALGYNALALPVAGILLFTGIGPAILFLLVNAVLLGRELTDMAWLRHCCGKPKDTPVAGTQRVLLGGAIAAMMAVPFLNLIAPIVGAAAGTHLTQSAMRAREADHA